MSEIAYFVDKVIDETKPDVVFHLAAQAIVRASYEDPVGLLPTNVLVLRMSSMPCDALTDQLQRS